MGEPADFRADTMSIQALRPSGSPAASGTTSTAFRDPNA